MRIRIELIEWYMKNNNLTKQEFCAECALSDSTFRKIMRGNYKYQTASIIRIAEKMKISVCDLYTND